MKSNGILILLIVIVLAGTATWFFIDKENRKKKKPKPTDIVPETGLQRVVPHSGQVYQGQSDLEFLQNLGFSEDYLKINH
ncbi:MAG TPA: hypothetical protein VF487_13150, partial [Chitinophagaceae bacterium]